MLRLETGERSCLYSPLEVKPLVVQQHEATDINEAHSLEHLVYS